MQSVEKVKEKVLTELERLIKQAAIKQIEIIEAGSSRGQTRGKRRAEADFFLKFPNNIIWPHVYGRLGLQPYHTCNHVCIGCLSSLMEINQSL